MGLEVLPGTGPVRSSRGDTAVSSSPTPRGWNRRAPELRRSSPLAAGAAPGPGPPPAARRAPTCARPGRVKRSAAPTPPRQPRGGPVGKPGFLQWFYWKSCCRRREGSPGGPAAGRLDGAPGAGRLQSGGRPNEASPEPPRAPPAQPPPGPAPRPQRLGAAPAQPWDRSTGRNRPRRGSGALGESAGDERSRYAGMGWALPGAPPAPGWLWVLVRWVLHV